MINNFKYSNTNKRYHTLDYHYKEKYGTKIAKISLNTNFTCPNLDGNVGFGGCIYCSSFGSGNSSEEDLLTQFENEKKIMLRKWPNAKLIGYFQAHTNTYAPVNILKEKYELILKQKDVIGLNIATRPDAISKECLDYLNELNKKTNLTIELGLQTIKEETTKLINRCHSLKCFENMVKKLREKNIDIVVHIINGLPYETRKDMINTIKYLNNLDIQGIKIHMLHILKNTALNNLYSKEKFHILTKEEYISIVVEQLEYLRPEIVINRITGDPIKEDLVEPTWLIKKFRVLNDIDKLQAKLNSYQGKRVS